MGRVKGAAASLSLPSSDAVVLLLVVPAPAAAPPPAAGAPAAGAALAVAAAAAAAAALPGVVVLVAAVGPVPAAWEAAGVVPRLSSSMSMAISSSWPTLVLRGVSCGMGESVARGHGHKKGVS